MTYGPYQPAYPVPYQFFPQPVAYQGQVQQSQQTVPQPPATIQNTSTPISTNITWVDGFERAKEYPIAMGNTVILMDYDGKTVYKKSTDLSGKPLPMEIFDLIPREEANTEPKKEEIITSSEQFVSKNDFNTVISNIERLEKKLTELAEREDEEMVIVPVKKRGRKASVPNVVIDTEAEVIDHESNANT